MPDKIRRVQYYHFEVPDRPGEGARVLEKLREAGVHLLAITAFPVGAGKSQASVVPQDPAAFPEAARRAGIKISAPKEAFLLQGGDRTGVAADVLRRLAKVNVTAVNATVAQGGGFGMIVWVKPEDVAPAARALGL
jgi:hypothetical protein